MPRESDLRAIHSVCKHAARKYHPVMELADFQQEAWIWLQRNEEKLEGLHEEDPPRAGRLITDGLRRHLNYIGDKERAARCSGDPDDQYYYGRVLIRHLLGYLFTSAAPQAAVLSLLPKSKLSAQEAAGNTPTWRADLGLAYARLNLDEKRVIFAYHGLGWTYEQIEDHMGIPAESLRRRLSRSVTKIQNYLGGPAAVQDGYYTGARSVLTNAAAQHQTRVAEVGG